MRLVLIADVYPPLRSSGAVQLRDLSQEFARQGHMITVLVASPELDRQWQIEQVDGVCIVRLKAPKTKDMGYLRRTLGEFLMPFSMLRNFKKTPLSESRFDGVIWYSPTIFLGPIVKSLKRKNRCPAYLIVRDIFPQWAADMGLISRGPAYRILNAVANFQYSVADVIGVQTQGNLPFFAAWDDGSRRRTQVLQNWLADMPARRCSIDVGSTNLSGRRIFVYAGNMGVAQGINKLIDLADKLKHRRDVGFLFVGRGSASSLLGVEAKQRGLDNVQFFDEIDPDEIPGLYSQCDAGIVCLDARHRTHNIPGKFVSYMHSGLPVLASINADNDLVSLITERRVGRVSTRDDGADLEGIVLEMLQRDLNDSRLPVRCQALAREMFSAECAVQQIARELQQS
jgi:glycosyltransferase involved in cell wall biosynthesis